jgi:hypothetical protein
VEGYRPIEHVRIVLAFGVGLEEAMGLLLGRSLKRVWPVDLEGSVLMIIIRVE